MNYINYKKYTKFFLFFLIFSGFLTSFSLNLVNNQKKLGLFFKIALNPKLILTSNEYWANEIQKGGYILYFRHAEREKWIDLKMYDALETDLHDNGKNSSRFAEKDYFDKAVCLNSRGKVQARAMGEIFKLSKLPVSKVISSPSCRARQTANISLGRIDEMNRNLVHPGPYIEKDSTRHKYLKNYLLNQNVPENSNVLISAHNGVITMRLFDNLIKLPYNEGDLYLEEGGFYVISNRNGKLKLEHEFHTFYKFSKTFFKRDFK